MNQNTSPALQGLLLAKELVMIEGRMDLALPMELLASGST